MKKIALLLTIITLFSCEKDDNTKTIDVAYFRANLNGWPIDYTQNNSVNPKYFNYGSFDYQSEGSEHSHYYISKMENFFPLSSYPGLGIRFDNMYITNDSSTETAAFYGLFQSPPTNFLTETEQIYDWKKGLQIIHYSSSGAYYTTSIGDQTGSKIIFTDRSVNISKEGRKSVTLTGFVNCKLYSYFSNTAKPITLTNGAFKLVFQEYVEN